MAEFSKIIAKLNQDYATTLKAGTGDAYSRLSTIMTELENYLREYIQSLSEKDMKQVIAKLKKGETINPDDLAQIRLWIVGDAEYYAKMENNFNDWQAEFRRLVDEISRYENERIDINSAWKLRALFRDAINVLSDIFYFVEQKDRVEKFTETTQEIDPEERAVLVRLLEQKLQSSDF